MQQRMMGVIFVVLTGLGFWDQPGYAARSGRDMLYQISTLDALVGGVYEGDTTIKELKRFGNFGIGTFNDVDGEMVLSEGICYQVRTDGKAYRVPDTWKTPFSTVTFFEPDLTLSVQEAMDFSALREWIDKQLPSTNLFYAIRITGTFEYVKTRSVPAQQKPYTNTLVEVTAKQPTFEFHNVSGTLMGFRNPGYVKGINFPGYHVHFLDAAKTKGGHLLDARVSNVKVEIDITPEFRLRLPDKGNFLKLDLDKDRREEVNKVEKSR